MLLLFLQTKYEVAVVCVKVITSYLKKHIEVLVKHNI